MSVTPTYDASAGRVRVVVTALPANPAGTNYAVLDRFDTAALTGGVTVRGGAEVDVPTTAGATGTFTIDDYEFEPDVALTYRVRTYSAAHALLQTQTGTVTAALAQVWLKSPTRPFLNRPVTVVDFGDVTSPARGGVLEVVGRRLPVAVTEVRGSRRYDLVLRAVDRAEADAIELFLSFGDVVYVQVPAACSVPRSMYAFVGDSAARRAARHDSPVRYVSLPLTEVDAPDPTIVGFTITWAGVQSTWATWADLLADPAVPTWLDVQQYVADPNDEITG